MTYLCIYDVEVLNVSVCLQAMTYLCKHDVEVLNVSVGLQAVTYLCKHDIEVLNVSVGLQAMTYLCKHDVEAQEVNQLSCSIDLCLHYVLGLRQKTVHSQNITTGSDFISSATTSIYACTFFSASNKNNRKTI